MLSSSRSRVFVISDNPVGSDEVKRLLDSSHIVRDSQYVFFNLFGGAEVFSRLENGIPQLVLIFKSVSLTPTLLASEIKNLNHKAVVVMITDQQSQFSIAGSAVDANVVAVKIENGVLAGIVSRFLIDTGGQTPFDRVAFVSAIKALG
jgi:hypothetical protein